MLSTIIDVVLGHPVIAISILAGYALAVIAPVPFLSRAILDGWTKFGGKITSFVSSLYGKITGAEAKVTSSIEESVESKL